MKKIKLISITMLSSFALFATMNSCKTSSEITAKSGAQIWGENCVKCHNSPSPESFSDVEWEIAGMHMQIRANLTPDETRKVIAFLETAN